MLPPPTLRVGEPPEAENVLPLLIVKGSERFKGAFIWAEDTTEDRTINDKTQRKRLIAKDRRTSTTACFSRPLQMKKDRQLRRHPAATDHNFV